jgi:subtilase family serine protease
MSVQIRIASVVCLSALLAPRAFCQAQKDSQDTAAIVVLGGTNPRARPEFDRGSVERARRLHSMTLVLRRSHYQQASLERFLNELQDPSSPKYHRWLNPSEFGDRFGASKEQLDRAEQWLRSQGFQVESANRARSWIVFQGTVSQVEQAFHTEIHRYKVGTREHFAPVRPPSVGAEIAVVVSGIRGLDDFYLEPSLRVKPMLGSTTPSAIIGNKIVYFNAFRESHS